MKRIALVSVLVVALGFQAGAEVFQFNVWGSGGLLFDDLKAKQGSLNTVDKDAFGLSFGGQILLGFDFLRFGIEASHHALGRTIFLKENNITVYDDLNNPYTMNIVYAYQDEADALFGVVKTQLLFLGIEAGLGGYLPSFSYLTTEEYIYTDGIQYRRTENVQYALTNGFPIRLAGYLAASLPIKITQDLNIEPFFRLNGFALGEVKTPGATVQDIEKNYTLTANAGINFSIKFD